MAAKARIVQTILEKTPRFLMDRKTKLMRKILNKAAAATMSCQSWSKLRRLSASTKMVLLASSTTSSTKKKLDKIGCFFGGSCLLISNNYRMNSRCGQINKPPGAMLGGLKVRLVGHAGIWCAAAPGVNLAVN